MTPQRKRTTERGFTLIELLIVVAIISIIAAVAVPNLLKSRQSGNEVSAATSLMQISKAQVLYSVSCGGGAYAAALTTLGTPSPGTTEYATAVPQTFGQTGSRSFAINTAGTVWMNSTAAAPTEPFGAPAQTYR